MHCVNCGREITKWQKFLGFFWKGYLNITEFSGLWSRCCSYKCYGERLEILLRELKK